MGRPAGNHKVRFYYFEEPASGRAPHFYLLFEVSEPGGGKITGVVDDRPDGTGFRIQAIGTQAITGFIRTHQELFDPAGIQITN